MSGCCDCGSTPPKTDISGRYRRILWIALAANLVMFVVEMASGWNAGSVSLLADAVDFFGDAVNYGLSLAVLSMALIWRSRVALIKGLTMGAYGLFVLAQAGWIAWSGSTPEALTMGIVGTLALLVNGGVAVMLYAFREGDANMQSVWLCSRNDAIGNIAVVLAAAGVFGTSTAWPDLFVAGIMGLLGISAARRVIVQARRELSAPACAPGDGRLIPGTK